MENYQAHTNFVLRSPLLPFDGALQSLLATTDPDEQAMLLFRICNERVVNDALFLASPVLHAQLEKRLNGKEMPADEEEQLLVSLTRYFLRMSTRCTPFGMFAGCTLGEWGNENNIRLALPDAFNRHTRPDMDYLCQLAQNLAESPGIKENLLYFPNTSRYVFGHNIRFVDYYYQNQRRFHRLASAEYSEYIDRLFRCSKNGATLLDLALELTDDEINREEALEFLYELVDGKLLVSELDGNVTGQEMLERMTEVLRRLPFSETTGSKIRQLEQLRATLAGIDRGTGPERSGSPYQAVLDIVDEIGLPYDTSRLLQVDLAKPADVAILDTSILESAKKGISVLNRVSSGKNLQATLDQFKKDFTLRYETKAIPLLEALDVESGIGYNTSGQNVINPLIDNLPQFVEENEMFPRPDKVHLFLLQKLIAAHQEGRYEIVLTDSDLEGFQEPNWNNLPDSISALVQLIDTPDDSGKPVRLYLKNASGSSCKLLGRFTHLGPDFHAFTRSIAEAESKLNEDAVIAEIVHLPESRIGNILMRTHVRDYEIPYLAYSTLPPDRQIHLQDIMVSVEHNEVILYSHKLRKRILPVMSNAHNYSHKALPVYQFLCDLQYQNNRSGLYFSWGRTAGEFTFLPRLVYENIVLSRATWQISRKELKTILELKKGADILEVVQTWKNLLKMPDQVLVLQNDNELFVDFNNYLCVQSFLHEVRKNGSGSMQIAEFLYPDKTTLIRDNVGQSYSNELIVILSKIVASRKPAPPAALHSPQTSLKRTFPIGSEWLYFKIYCGVKTSDEILGQQVFALAQALQQKKHITSWFFIRYADPDPHIRLRFHLTEIQSLGQVVDAACRMLEPLQENRLIWKIQTDTYEREVERYGASTIEATERLFHSDSLHTLWFLNQMHTFTDEHRWLYSLLAADDLLDAFELELPDKLEFCERMQISYEQEFHVGESQVFKKMLNGKFREHRQNIVPLLDRTGDFQDLYDLIANRRRDTFAPVQEILRICNKENIAVNTYLPSYIHMLFNRLFTSNQRLYELTLYTLLHGYYRQVYHTNKKGQLVA